MKRILLVAAVAALGVAFAPNVRADEIDDAIEMFTADDGLSAEEKIPALKALVEENLDNPRVDELVKLLRGMADEVGDDETKQWIEEARQEWRATELLAKNGEPQDKLAKNGEPMDGEAQDGEALDGEPMDGGAQDKLAKDGEPLDGEALEKLAKYVEVHGDGEYAFVEGLDEEGYLTPDARTEEEKLLLYTIEDAQAAADAAATEALKSGTKPWMPPEEALNEADEAFKRLGPIPAVPKAPKARVALPAECVADDFLNNGTALGAIVNLRERMRFALGSMSDKDEEEFDRQFDKALEFPAENIIAWCTNALPIVTEITRLRVALVNEAMNFDETLDEMNMARKVGNYEEAHTMMCSLSRTTATMKAIKAQIEELMPQFEALGEMPDPAEERKKAAKEYEEAKETIQEYFAFGEEVQDGTIEGEWEPYERYVEYVWFSTNRTDGTEGQWELNKRTGGGFLGASLFDQKKITIKPITQFGENSLMSVYIYGEGYMASKRFIDDEADKTRGESDSKDYWFEPEGNGVFARYRSWNDGDADRYALKAAKDNDGKDVLLYCEHTTSFVDDDEKKSKNAKRVVKHTYKTTAFRRTGDCPLILPMSDENAAGTKSGRTVEEKKKTAEKAYKEESEKFEKAKVDFHKIAEGSPFLDAPAPYELYYVLEGSAMAEKPSGTAGSDSRIVVVQLRERRDNGPLDAREGQLYRMDMEQMDPEPRDDGEADKKRPSGIGYVASTKRDSDCAMGAPSAQQKGPFAEYEWADHGNNNCLDQACNYKVYFIARSGKRLELDFAEASFLLKWLCPTTVMRASDNEPCVIDILPTVKFRPCSREEEMKPSECGLEASFGREKEYGYSAPSMNGLFGKDDSGLEMGYTNEVFAAGTDAVMKFSVEMGFSLPATKDVFFVVRPRLGSYVGSEKKVCYRYRLMWMDAAKAREIANSLDAKFREEAIAAWKSDVPKELDEAKAADCPEDERVAAAMAKQETREFHESNIKWINETITRLQKQMDEAQTESERYSLRVAIAGAQADKIHEEDMIRAVETGEFHASRTPWDDLTAAKFREDIVREVKEFSAAEHARKFVENMASKLNARNEAGVWNQLNELMDEDPLNAEKMMALSRQVKERRMEELENAPGRAEAFERANRLDWIVTGLEYTKIGCDVAVSVGCGGAGWGAAKVLGCVYMATTGYIEGGVTNAFKKTVTFAYDSVDTASEFIDGFVEGGWKGALKRGEIAFAMHYGVPYLLDTMKGPPDGTGCWNSFDTEKLKNWNPKAATRKPLAADVNAEFFEKKFSKKLIENWKDKTKALDTLKATKGVDSATMWKAKKEYYNALGKVNECPMAKAQLKYNNQYLKDGTSKEFAERCSKWQEAVKKKALINLENRKGYNKQKFLDFRNESSMNSVGMDLDIGLDETPNVTVMRGGKEVKEFQITRNGQRVTKYQYCQDAQDEVNRLVKLSTGCEAQKQYVNVTYSGHPEAYKRLELLKNSKNEEYMRQIFSHSSSFEVEQAFDVSRFKADEMAHVKGHPKIMRRYEQLRGWSKDYENLYGPALRGEVKALNAERTRLAKIGRDLPKRDIVRCERMEKTLKQYDKIYKVAKDVGTLKTPIYMANIELERVTDKDIPELITDLQTTFKSWNIGEKKNQRGLMIVEPKNTGVSKAFSGMKDLFKRSGNGKQDKELPNALPAPEQPKALPAPEKKPVLMLPWFGGKK